ncbi:ras guanine nucleotide exchange factor domain-containing protein [Dipodascopsis tothii]|uniref:ras guanine nucleotide exchange factor domain-containing protein n=1 Tax=Dipodascopsis tothii TaxID=44089 RepID=UPI0034CDBA3E
MASALSATVAIPHSLSDASVDFYPFLRTAYQFTPSLFSLSVVSNCLSFDTNEIVLLHSLHPSGWGDGTMLSTGQRGWLPTNYCEPYEPSQITPFLLAALNFITNPRSETGRCSQVAVTTVVSGVRALLDLTDCLTRDSYMVCSSEPIRKNRRLLLAELASLVSAAKTPDDSVDDKIGHMIAKTYRLVRRAVAFHDIWIGDERNAGMYDAAAYPFNTETPGTSLFKNYGATGASSTVAATAGASLFPDILRVSALARLNSTHEALLWNLGYYISKLHIQSRTPSILLVTTRQTVYIARQLLSVVDAVGARSAGKSSPLEAAQRAVYERIAELVTAARDVVASKYDEASEINKETQRLVEAAIMTLRDSSVCVARAKHVLDKVGDFEIDVDRKFLEFQYQTQASRRPASDREATRHGSVGTTATTATTPNSTIMPPAEDGLGRLRPAPDTPAAEDPRYANVALEDRIMYNGDGQIQGATLEALVKKLTSDVSTPDALVVSTFFMTFRLFTTPSEFAAQLLARFESFSRPGSYGANDTNALAGRLRVYNAIKGWLESHWRPDMDHVALPLIRDFAAGPLKEHLPFASSRLVELIARVADAEGPLVPRAMSKLRPETTYGGFDAAPAPTPIVNKHNMAAVAKYLADGGAPPSILAFDPLELARQLTLRESRLFCRIMPEELLKREFGKDQAESLAHNVKAMSTLSTDLAFLIQDSIVAPECANKVRMNFIKQWIRVAEKCLELKNYNCMMAITLALQSSVIVKLKKTWELVPPRYHTLFNELKNLIVIEKNYASYRMLLRSQDTPCIPYLGLYLSDLVFTDEGNPDKRNMEPENPLSPRVINFDKFMRTTKIIADLQRFQVPYQFHEVADIQSWISAELGRVHAANLRDRLALYNRSCEIEERLATRGLHASAFTTSRNSIISR